MINLITGNKFKKICNYSYDEEGFIRHSEPKNNEILKIFLKIEFVDNFFQHKKINQPYILITHNGDRSIDEKFLPYLNDQNLVMWYGQNVNAIHHKLKSVPIGIANERWPHGDESKFMNVFNSNIEKNKLIYVNFDIGTNLTERTLCLNDLNKKGLIMEKKLPFENYLIEVAKSYFIVSPNGNGIDCHKIWEALYLKTIPIVTKSINIDYYKNFPIFVLNQWSDIQPEIFTIDFYNKLWNNFDIKNIDFDFFLKNQINLENVKI